MSQLQFEKLPSEKKNFLSAVLTNAPSSFFGFIFLCLLNLCEQKLHPLFEHT